MVRFTVQGDRSAAAKQSPAGSELARAVLEAARAKSPASAKVARRTTGKRPTGYSGAGPDPRDPAPLGAVLAALVKERGWERPAAEARLFGMWASVVGPEVAARCRPVKLDDGELTIEAESTAWATQLRLLSGTVLKRIAAEVGHGVVRKLTIRGPVTPSWVRGPKRVRGRGPRDAYG